ncbi:MAG TPA: hypothetical protein VD772_06480, partial [Anseongella sp.]|nr:hypothetical protein [Anseongella sp.]
SLILYGGILLLLAGELDAAAAFLARQLSFLTDLMKRLMHFFSELPGAVLDGLWITCQECLGFYLLIFFLSFFLRSGKMTWLRSALLLSILLALSFALENRRMVKQRLLIFFSTGKTTAIGFLAGKQAVLLLEEPLTNSVYAYSIKPFLDSSGIKTVRRARLEQDFRNHFLVKKGPYLQFFDKRLVLQGKAGPRQLRPGEVLPADLLLVTENAYLHLEKAGQPEMKMLASGAAVSGAMERYLEKYCRGQGIQFYSLKRSGALLLNCRAKAGKP